MCAEIFIGLIPELWNRACLLSVLPINICIIYLHLNWNLTFHRSLSILSIQNIIKTDIMSSSLQYWPGISLCYRSDDSHVWRISECSNISKPYALTTAIGSKDVWWCNVPFLRFPWCLVMIAFRACFINLTYFFPLMIWTWGT